MSDDSVSAAGKADAHSMARFSDAPIGASRQTRSARWVVLLMLFMRLAALIWLAKGLLHWADLIGLVDAGFLSLRLSRQGALIALAVLDLVAAVGMWLTSSWGAAVWLIVLTGEAVLPFVMPDMVFSVANVALSAVSALVYLVLVWRAMKEEKAP